MSNVVVIGGGVVGSAAAYRLARDGVPVTLVDRADPGHATAAGAGIIAPATSLAQPAAFYPLAFAAVAHYADLLAQLGEDGEPDTGYEVVGGLFIATSDAEEVRLADMWRLLERRGGEGAPNIGALARLGPAEARALFPALGQVRGGIHLTGAARVDGRRLRAAVQRAAQKRGATLLRGDAALVRAGERVTHVVVDGRSLPVGAAIIAGGAWSAALGASVGVALPVYPQRGQILHLELRDAETGAWPIVLGFHAHYLLTFPRSRVVAGATREDEAGYDHRVTAGGAHEALGEALRVAPGLADATLREVRVGFRPASPDRLPLLGRAPDLRNVYVATGHGASGLQLGPYSGAVVAEVLRGQERRAGQGGPPAIDLTPYSPERFV